MKKSILIFTLLVCASVNIFAADEKKEEKWKKPSGSQICFIYVVLFPLAYSKWPKIVLGT